MIEAIIKHFTPYKNKRKLNQQFWEQGVDKYSKSGL